MKGDRRYKRRRRKKQWSCPNNWRSCRGKQTNLSELEEAISKRAEEFENKYLSYSCRNAKHSAPRQWRTSLQNTVAKASDLTIIGQHERALAVEGDRWCEEGLGMVQESLVHTLKEVHRRNSSGRSLDHNHHMAIQNFLPADDEHPAHHRTIFQRLQTLWDRASTLAMVVVYN